MDYQLETLDDTGFQKLCQALLVKAFPNVVCFPVNQPDGGRDALLRGVNKSRQAIAFQVKFSRDPKSATERDAVQKLIVSEKEKVAQLKERGVTAYYLITNVQGTAHLDAGSIDRSHEALSHGLEIDTYCWWRDDIERRLDGNADVKWSYPSILRGTDILQRLVSDNVADRGDIKRIALRAYIASQYQTEQDLKFKQVELQNKIIDLFTDVPVRRLGREKRTSYIYERATVVFEDNRSVIKALEKPNVGWGEQDEVLCSDVLIRSDGHGELSKIVLEGAPGQGKSTITQYVCQVNRLKILDKVTELSKIRPEHAQSHIRIPFRVDLRDYAIWLAGRNPFSPAQDGRLPIGTSPTLESFLTAQISSCSGGFEFKVADFSDIISKSHILVVLDGFDEVADIATRRALVDNIQAAAQRLISQTLSAQLIVTSRPTAFANSPGFPQEEWLHLELQPLSTGLIELYADRWSAAKGLAARPAAEFKSVLRNRMGQSHIRDLARNPMQLAILLSLINTKGLSLPDKRTALYDAYVDLFFSREAEKSDIVRDHRDLLVVIHRYLAWVLQAEAETAGNNGSVSEVRMRSLIREFLRDTGYDESLVDLLFTGMVERVVALVSRVIGSYEFEVQPLREYFCARYLYETAPYSPQGFERRGTKPDRFITTAMNFYWLNTVRFYAGCYSSGELASLADGISELSERQRYEHISQPRRLALTLLSDWVFMQQPHTARRVVEFLMASPGFGVLLSSVASDQSPISMQLPIACGRGALAQSAMLMLHSPLKDDVRRAICKIVTENSADSNDVFAYWLGLEDLSTLGDHWIALISPLRVGHRLAIEDWSRLFRKYGVIVLKQILLSERFDVLYARQNIRRAMLEAVVNAEIDLNEISVLRFISAGPIEAALASFSSITFAALGRAIAKAAPLYALPGQAFGIAPAKQESDGWRRVNDDALSPYVKVVRNLFERPVGHWKSDFRLWGELIRAGEEEFGPSLMWFKLAILAADACRVKRPDPEPEIFGGIGVGVLESVRLAKNRADDPAWWEAATSQQLDDIWADGLALTLVTTASEAALHNSTPWLEEWLSKRTAEEFKRFTKFVSAVFRYWDIFGRPRTKDKKRGVPKRVSARLLILFMLRSREGRQKAIESYLAKSNISIDPVVREYQMNACYSLAAEGRLDWATVLPIVREGYMAGQQFDIWRGHLRGNATLSEDVAKVICTSPELYPLALVEQADKLLTEVAGANVERVSEVAKQDGWFVPPLH